LETLGFVAFDDATRWEYLLKSLRRIRSLSINGYAAQNCRLEKFSLNRSAYSSLERLSIVNFVGDGALNNILTKRFAKLTHIMMKNCAPWDNVKFGTLGNITVGLKCLILKDCYTVDDEDLELIANKQPLLKEISILLCPKVSSNGLKKLLHTCHELRILEAGEQMSDEIFACLESILLTRHSSNPLERPCSSTDERIFAFIRDWTGIPSFTTSFSLQYLQSSTQNLNPWITFTLGTHIDQDSWFNM